MSEFQIVFTVLGSIPVLYSVYLLCVWIWLQSWPATTGKIKGSRVIKFYGSKGNGGDGMGMAPAFQAYVRYEYNIDGKIYSSKNIKVGLLTFSGPYFAKKYVARYPVHSLVDIYYNPRYPKMAYLDKSLGIGVWTSMLAGLFFVVAAQMI